jgi:hypothetical protein
LSIKVPRTMNTANPRAIRRGAESLRVKVCGVL